MPEAQWRVLDCHNVLAPFLPHLVERRRAAAALLSPAEEQLLADLAPNGLVAWAGLYHLAFSQIRITAGATTYTAGEAWNPLNGGDHGLRAAVAAGWEQAWAAQAPLCAAALNHFAGMRLAMYRRRGWDLLDEALVQNRTGANTLAAMWRAVEGLGEPLARYLDRKAAPLDQERLDWFDVYAPLDAFTNVCDYAEGAARILAAFDACDAELGAYARRLFAGGVDAEDRPLKASGGQAWDFPDRDVQRVMVTWSGTMYNQVTLAHEIGHAFHFHLLSGRPFLGRQGSAFFEEMAAVFAGMLMMNHGYATAPDQRSRLGWLDHKLGDAAQYLTNMLVRFRFETQFYAQRAEGTLTVDQLNALMLDAQRQAFHERLGRYHPHFWASKQQFYLPDAPFYYCAYPFGYLLCCGILAHPIAREADFADRWKALLRDTGHMSTEALAAHHLGVDLAADAFWQQAAAQVTHDVEAFLALTGPML